MSALGPGSLRRIAETGGVTYVIDTSAILALVYGETGGRKVAEVLGECVASPVILVECLSKAASKGYDVAAVQATLLGSGLCVAELTPEDLSATVELHALAKKDVSLADRFCLALALRRGLTLVTADRPWARLGLPVELHLIR